MSVIKASGILFVTPDRQALFLKRGPNGDNPGEWCFPGGRQEEGETLLECAVREAIEECGAIPDGERIEWTRRIANREIAGQTPQPTNPPTPPIEAAAALTSPPDDAIVIPGEKVDFTTFLQFVPEEFTPRLSGEHTDFMWIDIPSVAGLVRADAEFREADHPRDEDGKFSENGGGSSHLAAKMSEGKRVASNGEPLPAHIEALKIPPAWTDVTFSPDPRSDLLATGKDSKGRRQAIYSEAFSAKQAAAKFARINELNQKFDYISDQNEAARVSGNRKKAAAADCTKLIMTTGIRPGSEDDTGAEKKAYGATTLEGRHVIVEGDSVTLRFVGKKGVSLNIPVTDDDTAKMLRQRKEIAGEDGQLFPINEKTLLDHVHSLDGGGFNTKDFRTLLGTRTAMDEIAKRPAPKDMTSYKKAVMSVARSVASKLGNTPVIALQSYINPSVFADWRIAA